MVNGVVVCCEHIESLSVLHSSGLLPWPSLADVSSFGSMTPDQSHRSAIHGRIVNELECHGIGRLGVCMLRTLMQNGMLRLGEDCSLEVDSLPQMM